MLIDTHLHQKKHSGDSFISLEEIVDRAKELGLDGICITDHESNGIMEEAKLLGKKESFIIITGAEILTYEGDMTVFGLQNLPDGMIHAEELIDLVRKAGGVAICSHPYRQNNRGMGDHMKELDYIFGIEAFNGSTPEDLNEKAYDISVELDVPALGGSDAHRIEQVGKFATWMPDWVVDEISFIKAIKQGLTMPVIFEQGSYKVLKDENVKKASYQR